MLTITYSQMIQKKNVHRHNNNSYHKISFLQHLCMFSLQNKRFKKGTGGERFKKRTGVVRITNNA